jgi:hypothetical protein
VTVPRFYFHFVAKTRIEDDAGETFIDEERALLHAQTLAAQMARSGNLVGCTIVVANEKSELFEVPLTRLHS